jgi:hypothetical protein
VTATATVPGVDESPEVAFRPKGHPVAWFVAVVATLIVLLWLSWWGGLVTARVTVGVEDLTNAPEDSPGRGRIDGYILRVANDGPLDVELVGTGVSGFPDRTVPAVRIRPGESTLVHLPLGPDPCPAESHIRVQVRSPVGIVRRIEQPRINSIGYCPT